MGETRDINTAEEGARIKTRDKCPLSRDRKSQLLFLYLFISLENQGERWRYRQHIFKEYEIYGSKANGMIGYLDQSCFNSDHWTLGNLV